MPKLTTNVEMFEQGMTFYVVSKTRQINVGIL